jgi:hypothetical protein
LKVKLDTVIPKINVKMGEWGQGGLNIKKTVSVCVWGGGGGFHLSLGVKVTHCILLATDMWEN